MGREGEEVPPRIRPHRGRGLRLRILPRDPAVEKGALRPVTEALK